MLFTDKQEELCRDQKGFFEHLRPRSIVMSTLRVSSLQASQILTNYVTDQLRYEASLNEDNISALEYNHKTQQWEEEEWPKRWRTFPGKLKTALMKYHVLVLTMRFYEYVIGRFMQDDKILLDKLTKDAFRDAVVKSRSQSQSQSQSHRFLPPNGQVQTLQIQMQKQKQSKSYVAEMFETCIYSNMISFLADYSIQQGLLIYAYYTYVRNVQRRNRLERYRRQQQENNNELQSLNLEYELVSSVPDGGDGVVLHQEMDESGRVEVQRNEEEIETNVASALNLLGTTSTNAIVSSLRGNDGGGVGPIHGGLVLSFLYKSSQLIVTRAIALFMAGLGGALGSCVVPGWGTVLGVQLGDACVGALLEN